MRNQLLYQNIESTLGSLYYHAIQVPFIYLYTYIIKYVEEYKVVRDVMF